MKYRTSRQKKNRSKAVAPQPVVSRRDNARNGGFIDNRPQHIMQTQLMADIRASSLTSSPIQRVITGYAPGVPIPPHDPIMKGLTTAQQARINDIHLHNHSTYSPAAARTQATKEQVDYRTSAYAAEARSMREDDDAIQGRNIATICYTALASGKTTTAGSTYETTEHSDGRHSEARLADWMVDEFGADYKKKVTFHWIFSERAACGHDYHDCRSKISDWFPEAELKEAFEYGSDGEEDGTLAVRRTKAKASRARGTKLVKAMDKLAGQVAAGTAKW